MGYSTYFYQQAGLADANAFDMTMGQYALGAIGTILSWFLMSRVGRRTLYLYGLLALLSLLLIIGSMLLVYTFTYDSTIGPVCYSLVAELSSTRLRSKTIVLARNVYNVFGIINNIWTPYMLNPSAWNWGAKTGFFWAGICFLCLTWTYFRLPEPKGRTYGELDILFSQKISARKFSRTDATQSHGETVRLASASDEVDENNGSGNFRKEVAM